MVWIWSNSSTNVVFDGHEMTAEVRIPRRGLSTAGVEVWIRDRVQYQALESAASDELSRMAELRKHGGLEARREMLSLYIRSQPLPDP
jgi:hypothetical protein